MKRFCSISCISETYEFLIRRIKLKRKLYSHSVFGKYMAAEDRRSELYLTTREEWHRWLEKNHSIAGEVWLIYYKKSSGKPRIPYVDAVEEALCFGWIDGKINKINDNYFVQRFTPRRSGSRWSQYNIERVQRLLKEGRMKSSGLKAYMEAEKRPELIYENRTDGDPKTPYDLMDRLNKSKSALENFMNFSISSRRMYIEWLNSAKRPETRSRRIEKIIGLAEKNIKRGLL
jgi:uncharacterized protein YdeI (YjbR/CyaY-like superfamily)